MGKDRKCLMKIRKEKKCIHTHTFISKYKVEVLSYIRSINGEFL